MFYVYVIKSKKDKKLYTAYTSNLKRRIIEHNSGNNKSAKSRVPFDLVYYEAYKSRKDTIHRERMLKLRAKALGQLKRRIANSLTEV